MEEWLIATLIAAATVLIFVAVLHRYGTGLSIDLSKWAAAHGVPVCSRRCCSAYLYWLAALDVSWAQELCIYMFIWMAKFGAAYGVRTGIHVGVDVFVNMLPAEFAQARDPVRPRCAARCSPRLIAVFRRRLCLARCITPAAVRTISKWPMWIDLSRRFRSAPA